jgi:hypothetical protein
VRSRVFIGASAWLLGAVTATAGSMIAVNQLAHGLFDQPTQLLGSSAVANLDHDSGGRSAASGSTPIPHASPSTPRPARRATPAPSQSTSTPAPSQSTSTSSSGGTLLVSPDGSVMAECLPAGAHLLYWSPDQGFQVDDVYRGPAPVARVTFQGVGGAEVVMNVSCANGTPVARLGHDH